MTEYWYRYNIAPNLSMLIFDEPNASNISVRCESLLVEKHTPMGVRLRYPPKGKFVLNNAVKQFASPTKERALVCFIARKRKQIEILQYRLDEAKAALDLAKKGQVHD
jgi:hypothetical protein